MTTYATCAKVNLPPSAGNFRQTAEIFVSVARPPTVVATAIGAGCARSRAKPMRSGSALEARGTLTSKQVAEFAAKARWQVHCDDTRAHRARCLDGRYKPGAGVIAMPGADVGVLALGLLVPLGSTARLAGKLRLRTFVRRFLAWSGVRQTSAITRTACRFRTLQTGTMAAVTAGSSKLAPSCFHPTRSTLISSQR